MKVEYHPLTVSDLSTTTSNVLASVMSFDLRYMPLLRALVQTPSSMPLSSTVFVAVSCIVSHTLSCFASLMKRRSAYWSSVITVVIQDLALIDDRYGITLCYTEVPPSLALGEL